MLRPFRLVITILAVLLAREAFSFSAAGHHVVAVLAYELLAPEEKAEIIRLLHEHPRFDKDFTPPESIANDPDAVARWQVGIAGDWPDIIRPIDELTRPSWHYQLGANLVLGGANAPDAPEPLPAGATLDTRDLYIGQAIRLCRKVLSDHSQSDADRATAICWLAHLVADAHQPCHAGSLYSPVAFPTGDRGANAVRLPGGGNLHSLWDGLLSYDAQPGDVHRRVSEITSDPVVSLAASQAADDDSELDPDLWLMESRAAAVHYVYSPEVLEAVHAVERGLTSELQPVILPEGYVEIAGQVARLRAAQAGHRLAAILHADL